jgi:hypothetical protein
MGNHHKTGSQSLVSKEDLEEDPLALHTKDIEQKNPLKGSLAETAWQSHPRRRPVVVWLIPPSVCVN